MRTILGWAVFLVLLGILGLFAYKVQYYYRHLKAGNIVQLPSLEGRFTVNEESGKRPEASVDESDVVVSDAPSLGAPEGSQEFSVVMFGDYECAYSQNSATAFRRLAVKYGDRVRFLYRDYPLTSMHRDAYQAAVAGECAQEQHRFWEYFDRLYSESADLGEQSLQRYAREAGLNEVQFNRCLDNGRYENRVNRDIAAADALGLRGTPTFYVGGRKIEGALDEDKLESIINKLLEG